MKPSICDICRNEKPVNQTNNRLVTESCGHVKCMDCLLAETDGCQVCATENIVAKTEPSDLDQFTCSVEVDEDKVYVEIKERVKKRKLETSHITVSTDEQGKCYTCTVCNKKFHARSQVAYHAYCNGQSKPYHCAECKKSFATQSHFKYHMRVHRDDRAYVCACGERFFQMSKLQRHRLKHTQEKNYTCPDCGKAFNNVSSLRKHRLTHSAERPHCCAACGARFRDTSNFRKHVAKHEGHSKPPRSPPRRAVPCPRCPLTFGSQKDMRRHCAVHSDAKPFRCKVCDRRFRRKDNLERHVRNTHPAAAAPGRAPAESVAPPANAVDNADLTEKNKLELLNPLPPLSRDILETIDKADSVEKSKLQLLNPLPPLSKDILQTIDKADSEKSKLQRLNPLPPLSSDILATIDTPAEALIDKSYILQANTARESVIFGPSRRGALDECEYVHKIKKPARWATQKDLSLPPVDETKIQELESKTHLNLDPISSKSIGWYKKILEIKADDEPGQGRAGVHWKYKMKLNLNW